MYLSVGCVVCDWFVFFKQKTAYEMRISDWSSDVCSSDLEVAPARPNAACSLGCSHLLLARTARKTMDRVGLESLDDACHGLGDQLTGFCRSRQAEMPVPECKPQSLVPRAFSDYRQGIGKARAVAHPGPGVCDGRDRKGGGEG